MTKKLYRVRVLLYVMAENASDACSAATTAPFDIFECRARRALEVDAGWEEAVPYNADDDRTCAQVLQDEKSIFSWQRKSVGGQARQGRRSLVTARMAGRASH